MSQILLIDSAPLKSYFQQTWTCVHFQRWWREPQCSLMKTTLNRLAASRERLWFRHDVCCLGACVRTCRFYPTTEKSVHQVKNKQPLSGELKPFPVLFSGDSIYFCPGPMAARSRLPELTCLNFLQGNSFSWGSLAWTFLLFWNFFLLSCRSAEIPPLDGREAGMTEDRCETREGN